MSFDDCLNFISYIAIGVIIGGRLGYVFMIIFLHHCIDTSLKGDVLPRRAVGAIVPYYAKHHKIVVLALLDMLAFSSTIGIGLGGRKFY